MEVLPLILGFRNHVYGLAMFARQIELGYGRECLAALNKVDWPRETSAEGFSSTKSRILAASARLSTPFRLHLRVQRFRVPVVAVRPGERAVVDENRSK